LSAQVVAAGPMVAAVVAANAKRLDRVPGVLEK
jgi:hypothetical protein